MRETREFRKRLESLQTRSTPLESSERVSEQGANRSKGPGDFERD